MIDIYDNRTLVKKVGCILEKLSKTSPYYGSITENDIGAIEKRIVDGLLYVDRKLSSTLVKRWKLYVPQYLINYLKEED